MKRFFITFFLGLLASALLGLAVLGILAATVNPDDYRDDIAKAVEKATGRQVVFQGSIRTSVFPKLGLKTGTLKIMDPAEFGGEPFMSVKSASFELALLPLLTGSVEVGRVSLDGLAVKLVKTSAGRANWEFSPAEQKAAAAAADDSVTALEDAAPKKPPTQAEEKKLDFRMQSLVCTNAEITYRDLRSGAGYRLDVAELTLGNARLGADMTAAFKGSAVDEKTGVVLSLEAAAVVNAAADGSATLNLSRLAVAAERGGPALKAELAAKAAYAASSGILTLQELKGSLEGSPYKGTLVVGLPKTPDAALSVNGSLDFNTLDLDSLSAMLDSFAETPKAHGGGASAPSERTAPRGEAAGLPASLRGLNADLALSAEKIVIAKMPITAFKAGVEAKNGKGRAPFTFSLFRGADKGEAGFDLSGKTPSFSLENSLAGLNVGELLAALSGKASLSGSLNSSLEVKGAGLEGKAILSSLNGKASMLLTGGEAKGFTLIPAGLPGVPSIPADFGIERISADWRITNGVAATGNFLLASSALKGTGGGSVNLPRESISFGIDFMLGGLPPAIPVTIAGPLSSPSAGVDMEKLAKNTAKGLLERPGDVGRAVEGLFRR